MAQKEKSGERRLSFFDNTRKFNIDTNNRKLLDVEIVRVGEARGHACAIDLQFVQDVVALGNNATENGIKCRLGHPNECTDTDPLTSFLGTFSNFRLDGDRAIADLYLAKYSDRADWLMQHAAANPSHFGNSIVFRYNWEYTDVTGAPVPDSTYTDENNQLVISNERLVITSLDASDIVDSPAATDGLFSAKDSKKSFARYGSQFFDSNPAIKRWAITEFKAGTLFPKLTEFLEHFDTAPTAHKQKPMNKIVLTPKAKLAAIKAGVYRFDITVPTDKGIDIVITTTDVEPKVGNPVAAVDGTPLDDDIYIVNGGGEYDGDTIEVANGVITVFTPAEEAAMGEDGGDAPDNNESLNAKVAELHRKFEALSRKGSGHTPDERGSDGGKKPKELTVTERIELARKQK
jgi:hypothetical protein